MVSAALSLVAIIAYLYVFQPSTHQVSVPSFVIPIFLLLNISL